MNSQGRTMLGALALCVLSICAFGAVNASALGLTAVECVEVGVGGKYNTAECLTPATAGKFETKVVANGTKGVGTATTAEHKLGSTAAPVAVFHSTIAGIEITVTCGKASSAGGTGTNEEVGGEMRIHGTGSVATYGECHVSPRAKPEKICSVQGVAPATAVGEIKTNLTTGISGPEHRVTVKAEEAGAAITKFNIIGAGAPCFTATTLAVEVTGEAVGRANTETHSHLTFDEASNKLGTLKANGVAAVMTATGFATNASTGRLLGAETF